MTVSFLITINSMIRDNLTIQPVWVQQCFILMAEFFSMFLNASITVILGIVLPTLRDQLDTSTWSIGWVIAAYSPITSLLCKSEFYFVDVFNPLRTTSHFRPVYHPYARDKIRTRVISVALVWENTPKYHNIKNRNSSKDKNVNLHISKMAVFVIFFHR